MFVSMWMSKDPITVTPDTSVQTASELMREHGIRRLLVTDDRSLLGIVSKDDLLADRSPMRDVMVEKSQVERTVATIMSSDPKTVSIHDPIAKAARIMRNLKIGGLPVMSGRHLVGVITESDIFDAFASMLSCAEESVMITIKITNSDDDWLMKLVKVAKYGKARLLSLSYVQHGDEPLVIARLAGNSSEVFVERVWKVGLSVLAVAVERGTELESAA